MKLPVLTLLKLKLEGEIKQSLPRPYLGMSQLGNPCRRALWYSFRWCYTKEITSRQKRIFERGDLEEYRITQDLEYIGVSFKPVNSLIGFAGHCRGHADGKIFNVPGFAPQEVLLVEFKTAKASSFKKFVTQGCKTANYQYFCQAQMYMRYEDIKNTLFIVVNKDTEERYYEIISFEPDLAESLEEKSISVIASDAPPEKIGGPTWYECKWCDAYQVCHSYAVANKSCRNCSNAIIKQDGEWYCNHYSKTLTLKEQEIERTDYACYSSILGEDNGAKMVSE